MANRIFALLVGINDYPSEVGKLNGCLNDVDQFHGHLSENFDKHSLAIEVLKDSDATRENVIAQFRNHLGKAKTGDVAVFQFCGHGARWASAKQFKEFYPDGKDEGLVCINSRHSGGFDLADKELAILISELAENDPHLAVILDCCHSGSGTRNADAFRGLMPRVTHEVNSERPLDSYLDGYYAKQHKNKQTLSIPKSRHILLAACEKTQLAQETKEKQGVFTSTLVEVLEKSGGDLSYADLFVRCRAAVRKRADNQNPQFETYDNFNSHSGFLGRNALVTSRRYRTYCNEGSWKIECGAIQGIPTDPEKTVSVALYPEDDQENLAGDATTIKVGPQESDLKLEFAADESIDYRAEITSLPVPPLQLYFKGDSEISESLQRILDDEDPILGSPVNAMLTNIENGARYSLSMENDKLTFRQKELDLLIQSAEAEHGKPESALKLLRPIMKHVAQWERSLALANLSTQMDPTLVEFTFSQQLENAQEHNYPECDICLDFSKDSNDQWKEINGKLKVRNRTAQKLHMVLAYFSTAYGILILGKAQIAPGDSYTTLWGDGPDDYFYLEEGVNESIENFKLIVSSEEIDDFLLVQDSLELGKQLKLDRQSDLRAIGTNKPMPDRNKLVYQNEWFTKDIRIKVVRQLSQLGTEGVSLAQDKIFIKGHPSIKANLSLVAASSSTRSAGDESNFYKAFESQDMQILNFASTRGENKSVLELSDIQNAASLKDNPLEIEVKMPLGENEGVLPWVYDGQHVLLGGDTYIDDAGNAHISIDHIPEIPDHRRSLGGSLKLYFFKTYLKQGNVNQLRWVDYKASDSNEFEYQQNKLTEKVRAAESILLLVHGIIGDTKSMASGIRACGLDQKFDLVLAYDYENLSTEIQDTAKLLKSDLAEVGIVADDNKRLTLLAHSMGGLVSRQFIEYEDGNKVVDHLVMCGTPNNGSPFGKIDGARNIMKALTTLSMNYLPGLIPFSSNVLLLLNRSKKISPTLEQMNPTSSFIETLNSSADPGIRYTILAGDVDACKVSSDQLFANLIEKVGQSPIFEALFDHRANDIAVGVESILGVNVQTKMPTRKNVACHHLNYFVSDAGQEALTAVDWES